MPPPAASSTPTRAKPRHRKRKGKTPESALGSPVPADPSGVPTGAPVLTTPSTVASVPLSATSTSASSVPSVPSQPTSVQAPRGEDFNEPATRAWAQRQLRCTSSDFQSKVQGYLDQCTHDGTNTACGRISAWFTAMGRTIPPGEPEARALPLGAPIHSSWGDPLTPTMAAATRIAVAGLPAAGLAPAVGASTTASQAPGSGARQKAAVVSGSGTPARKGGPSQHVNVPWKPSGAVSRATKPKKPRSRTPSPAASLSGRGRGKGTLEHRGKGPGRSYSRTPYVAPTSGGTTSSDAPGLLGASPLSSATYRIPTLGQGQRANQSTADDAGRSPLQTSSPQGTPIVSGSSLPSAAFVPSVERPTPGLGLFFGEYVPIRANFAPVTGSTEVPAGGVICTVIDLPDPDLELGSAPVPTPVLFQLSEPVLATGRILTLPQSRRDRQRLSSLAGRYADWPYCVPTAGNRRSTPRTPTTPVTVAAPSATPGPSPSGGQATATVAASTPLQMPVSTGQPPVAPASSVVVRTSSTTTSTISSVPSAPSTDQAMDQ